MATSDSSTTATLQTRTASILGTKFLHGLSYIDIDLSSAIKEGKPSSWKVQGLVSHSPASPHPLTARENQFFSINGRPVDLPSASRVIGDVWRRFDPSETGRRPACILAFTLPNQAFDVNLSPDKRQVLFTEESAILELIRNGLTDLWTEQSDGKFTANKVETLTNTDAKICQSGAKSIDNQEKDIEGTSDTSAIFNEEVNIVTPRQRRTRSVETVVESQSSNKQPLSVIEKRDITLSMTQTQPEALDTTTKDSVTTASTEKRTSEEANRTHEVDPIKFQAKPEKVKQRERRVWEQMKLNFNRIRSEKGQDTTQLLSLDHGTPSYKQDERNNDFRPTEMAVTREMRSKSTSSIEVSTTQIQSTSTKRHETSDIGSMLDSFAYESASSKDQVECIKMDSNSVESSEDVKCVSARRQKSIHLDSDAVFNLPKRKTGDDPTSSFSNFVFGWSQSDKTLSQIDRDCKEFDSTDSSEPENLGVSSGYPSIVAGALVQRNGRMIAGKRIISCKRRRRLQGRAREKDEINPPASIRDHSRRKASKDVFDWNGCHQREDSSAQVSYETTWASFSGTRSIIAQSQHSLVLMRKRRKLFHYSLKPENDTSDLRNSFPGTADTNQVNLRKEDFAQMSIIGQFNLGFILVRCRNHNLWILDQHACDEKYNFERLCKETIIHEQKLMTPLPLELSPSEEHCILEHMDVFETNGFRFDYDASKDPRHRLSLTALPHSGSGGDGTKAVQFGKEGKLYCLNF